MCKRVLAEHVRKRAERIARANKNGRSHKIKPADIPFAVVQEIYSTAVKKFDFAQMQLPLREEQFRKALTAQNMLASSKGLGGPQRAEVLRILDAKKTKRGKDRVWLQQQRRHIADASTRLNKPFYQFGK